MNRASFALLASLVVACALGESPEPTKVRVTTWNLEWFPNGSAHDATPEVQAQRALSRPIRRSLTNQYDLQPKGSIQAQGGGLEPAVR